MQFVTNGGQAKPFKDEDEFNKKLELIKENKERRKQGLPPLKFEDESNKPVILDPQEESAKEQEPDVKPPKISQKTDNAAQSSYSYLQSQMQGKLAMFQAEKFSYIAEAARKESHIIYKFENNKAPPKLGEKKNTKQTLTPIKVFYNELPNDIHYELDAMRAQVSDLQYVKSLQVPQVDPDGVVTPAVLTENDPDRTGLSNKQFAKLNEEINKLNKEIAAKMALWMYGIDEELLPQLETNSLSNALEAGLYREVYGIVNTSKNSAVY